jgi:hypothetical protein
MIRQIFAGSLLCATLVAFGCSCCHKNTCRPTPTPAPCCPPPGSPAAIAAPVPSGFEGGTSTVVPPGPPPGAVYGSGGVR